MAHIKFLDETMRDKNYPWAAHDLPLAAMPRTLAKIEAR